MTSAPRILIASAYGRGNWCAVRLTQLGFNVQLIDVSERLGTSLREDREGPFGFFDLRQWRNGEHEALHSLGAVHEVKGGFTLWLKSGPWELRGPTAVHRAQMIKQYEHAWPLVHQFGDVTSDRRLWIEKLRSLDFEDRWLASLASDFMSNQSHWPNEAFAHSIPASIFEPYQSREPERRNYRASLKWCSDQGVVVVENGEIPDLAIENKKVQGLEVRSDKSGFVRCHHLIWMLTSMETEHFSPRAFLKLYRGQMMEPEWCWMRYKLDFESSTDVTQLPEDFLFIEEVSLPWTHDNFVVFRRSFYKNSYHVWLRVPYSQRFHRDYLEECIQPLLENLQKRNPRLKVNKMTLPSEAGSHLKELGAPLFPLFRSSDLTHPPGVKLNNLWFSHPEYWPSYSWGSIFSSQNHMIAGLRQWWGEMNDEQRQKELEL